jgi:hypothetical protein
MPGGPRGGFLGNVRADDPELAERLLEPVELDS